ncbi:MAG: beta-lactamase family protein, partial [Candidatus Eisenbacteria bacterium]|nr:beta-lactamase family protein [Candidatus Eisenbacteria bacterium]
MNSVVLVCVTTALLSVLGTVQPVAAFRAEGPLAPRFAARLSRWETMRDSLRIPGLAIAVVRNDSLVLLATSGERDVARGLPVTPQTMFYIASCTKPLVATLSVRLDEQRRLALDTRCREVLPGFRLADSAATDSITLRDLLCHRAGLQNPIITMGEAYSGTMTPARFARLLAATRPTGTFEYSNLHYTIAGRMIAERCGGSWKRPLERELFAPLGMTRSTTSATRYLSDPDHAVPYSLEFGSVKPAFTKSDATMHAAGGVASSTLDLIRFLRFHLADGVLDAQPIMGADAI